MYVYNIHTALHDENTAFVADRARVCAKKYAHTHAHAHTNNNEIDPAVEVILYIEKPPMLGTRTRTKDLR